VSEQFNGHVTDHFSQVCSNSQLHWNRHSWWPKDTQRLL